MATLRIVSYNIHGQRDERAALDEVVRALAPDVLVLQEAPRRFRWRQRCAALARRFGLVYVAGGLPALGNLILVDLRVAVAGTRCLRFPLTPGRLMRGAVVADCVVAGRRLVVAGSHLSTDPLERPAQARLLRQELATVDDPLVLALDANDEPGSETWKVLAEGLVDPAESAVADPPSAEGRAAAAPGAGGRRGASTFPAVAPRRRIDAVFVDPRLSVVRYDVVDTPAARRASDHLPVLAELDW